MFYYKHTTIVSLIITVYFFSEIISFNFFLLPYQLSNLSISRISMLHPNREETQILKILMALSEYRYCTLVSQAIIWSWCSSVYYHWLVRRKMFVVGSDNLVDHSHCIDHLHHLHTRINWYFCVFNINLHPVFLHLHITIRSCCNICRNFFHSFL